jgi:hypothetical protein
MIAVGFCLLKAESRRLCALNTIAAEMSRADRDFDLDATLPYGLTIAAVD